jgi:hypothetical protein
MPIQIDRAAASGLAPRFADALALVRNESTGLGRVLMMVYEVP